MSSVMEFTNCYVCRSVDHEIVHNEDFGPMVMCSECGYSWIATYADIAMPVINTIAS